MYHFKSSFRVVQSGRTGCQLQVVHSLNDQTLLFAWKIFLVRMSVGDVIGQCRSRGTSHVAFVAFVLKQNKF